MQVCRWGTMATSLSIGIFSFKSKPKQLAVFIVWKITVGDVLSNKCVWIVIRIDHDTVCAGAVVTSIRHSTVCAGRHAQKKLVRPLLHGGSHSVMHFGCLHAIKAALICFVHKVIFSVSVCMVYDSKSIFCNFNYGYRFIWGHYASFECIKCIELAK